MRGYRAVDFIGVFEQIKKGAFAPFIGSMRSSQQRPAPRQELVELDHVKVPPTAVGTKM